ncbi:ankyrin repeat domain-containing protein [Streptomyces sp. NPDC051561]|uniref:ankyrin repeat domain-containing protein n=1 Tax=Streptomyces sp. NPDC051561 TaxID=3365658 RepID=UPI00378AE773
MDNKPTAGLRDLFEAVHGDEDDAVVRLLRAGAPAEATDEEGTTVLYAAVVDDRAGAVRLLLAAGADPDRPSGSGDGDLPLCAAAVGGHTEVTRALLAAGARPDLREAYGFTALAWAAGRGHAAVAEALLEYGADPDLPGPSGEPPLVLAARRGSAATVRVLLRHRASAHRATLEEALAEAERWLERDLEHSLREGLKHTYGSLGGDEFAVRRIAEDGGTTVVAELLRDGLPVAAAEQQTGHAAVVTRLECVLGISTPAAELAARAVRSGSPVSNNWRESVAVLWQRADAETLRAAQEWCADDPLCDDPLCADGFTFLHGTFAADVLARAAPAAAAVPLLRDLAARPGPAHLTRAAIRALGRHRDPSALPEVLAQASHEDAEVRRRVAEALGRLAGCGAPGAQGAPQAQEARAAQDEAAALIALTRDPDSAVRHEAVAALARSQADTPAVRDALARQVGTHSRQLEQGPPLDSVYAEAARGLAVRQDPRAAGALLRVLADGPPEGPGRAVAVQALTHLTDGALRRRLQSTFPRCR